MISAIIFDFFDVICPDDYKAWLDKYGYRKEGEFLRVSQRLDHGEIDVDEFFRVLSTLCNKDVAELRDQFKSEPQVDHKVIALIDELRTKYKIGLLSNAPSAFLRGILNDHDLERHFDEITISSEVGLIKPSAEAFHHILNKLHVLPGQAIFVDDNEGHVAGAEKAGLRGVLFTDVASLRRDLTQLDVL